MKRIVVVGSAGFIGSHLCEGLLGNGFYVIGVDNFDDFYPKTLKENNLANFIQHENFSFYELDITNALKLKNLPQFDLIVNLAAKAGVRPSIQNPNDYIKSNIQGNQNILDLLVQRDIKKYIFASSSSIYGNTKEIPFKEDNPCNEPISPYAYTKKTGEMMNYAYHNLYNITILNLRFFTVFGPRQRPDLAIHKFVKLIKNDTPIEMFGDGSSARDYTYVGDTVDGIIKSINYIFNQETTFDHFNLGNHYPVTLKTMISTIYSALNKTPNIIQKPHQKGEVDITFADIAKAKSKLGYNPKTSFETGIKKFIEWYEKTN